MRNIVIRLMIWISSRYSINLVDETRILNGADAVERGARWEAFYREDGGLLDMLHAMRKENFEAMSAVHPTQTDELAYLALSDRNIRKLQGRIEAVVAQGELEKQKIKGRNVRPLAPIQKSVA